MSFKARVRSFGYAFRGIGFLFREQPNARIHLCVMLCVLAAGFLFGLSSGEWCAVILCIGGVLMAEGFNSAVESLADKVCKEHDPLIGKAKDLAAGAVLLFVVAAVVVGLIIFLPHFLALVGMK